MKYVYSYFLSVCLLIALTAPAGAAPLSTPTSFPARSASDSARLSPSPDHTLLLEKLPLHTVKNDDGSFTTSYALTIKNTSKTDVLNDIRIVDITDMDHGKGTYTFLKDSLFAVNAVANVEFDAHTVTQLVPGAKELSSLALEPYPSDKSYASFFYAITYTLGSQSSVDLCASIIATAKNTATSTETSATFQRCVSAPTAPIPTRTIPSPTTSATASARVNPTSRPHVTPQISLKSETSSESSLFGRYPFIAPILIGLGGFMVLVVVVRVFAKGPFITQATHSTLDSTLRSIMERLTGPAPITMTAIALVFLASGIYSLTHTTEIAQLPQSPTTSNDPVEVTADAVGRAPRISIDCATAQPTELQLRRGEPVDLLISNKNTQIPLGVIIPGSDILTQTESPTDPSSGDGVRTVIAEDGALGLTPQVSGTWYLINAIYCQKAGKTNATTLVTIHVDDQAADTKPIRTGTVADCSLDPDVDAKKPSLYVAWERKAGMAGYELVTSSKTDVVISKTSIYESPHLPPNLFFTIGQLDFGASYTVKMTPFTLAADKTTRVYGEAKETVVSCPTP